ncbi:hypothetical protein RRG08_065623 [Elysia crispata]|uniref:Uncharacterized protein n=1 Tax=Elysia crispata TaxID=231223 RepID=A0AAE1D1J8_9GAST|nr:hypothetical protein RRG08_065623 [Elysia crispata]
MVAAKSCNFNSLIDCVCEEVTHCVLWREIFHIDISIWLQNAACMEWSAARGWEGMGRARGGHKLLSASADLNPQLGSTEAFRPSLATCRPRLAPVCAVCTLFAECTLYRPSPPCQPVKRSAQVQQGLSSRCQCPVRVAGGVSSA